jgi:hypothetical protein
VKPAATILVVPRYRNQVRQWLLGKGQFKFWSSKTTAIDPQTRASTVEETAVRAGGDTSDFY